MARRIAITGSTGLIGRHLKQHLLARGDQVVQIVRRPAEDVDAVSWLPGRSLDPLEALEGLDAIVHLAGAPIAKGRWTKARRRVLRDSRTITTAHIAQTLSRLKQPPSVFIQASAVGVYGDRGDERLSEDSPPGEGFLSQLTQDWEAAGAPFDAVGRRCMIRLGMVLSPQGGALKSMLPIFKAGLGGRLARGTQWVSWISILDAIAGIDRLIEDEKLQGPVNLVAPAPVRNAIFTQALGAALRRPAFLPAPALALQFMLGAMANELLLSSQRVTPGKLQKVGFCFEHPTIDVGLKAVLKG